jgi:predicted membrane protein
MYAALWRVLPGPWWVRVLILLVALAALFSVLLVWVFPWVDELLAPQDVTVSQ